MALRRGKGACIDVARFESAAASVVKTGSIVVTETFAARLEQLAFRTQLWLVTCAGTGPWARGRGILASPLSGPALCGGRGRVSPVLGHARQPLGARPCLARRLRRCGAGAVPVRVLELDRPDADRSTLYTLQFRV